MDAHRELKIRDQEPADQFAQEVNNHHMATTYLDHLNEDCLLKIFSQNSLTKIDLCALADTCKLFKQIAQQVFSKTLRIYKDNDVSSSLYLIDKQELVKGAPNVEQIFKNFGSCLVTLTVNGLEAQEINWAATHCIVGTLKEFEISRTEITEIVAMELKPIFRQLQKLTINDAVILCGPNVFANCDSLIELSVTFGEYCNNKHYRYNPILENNFDKLQRFAFKDCSSSIGSDSDQLLNFVERHKSLKCLHLPTHQSKANEDFFRKLGNSCKQLEELEIKYINDGASTQDFTNFENLKRLNLVREFLDAVPWIVRLQNVKSLQALEIYAKFDSKVVFEALPLLKNLRELKINIDFISETVQWTSLPQLKKLGLTGYKYVVGNNIIGNVVDIIRQLSNLEELQIFVFVFALSEKEFYEIVELVKGRRNVLTLKCQFEFSQSSGTYKAICDENSKVKLIKLKR